MLAMSALYSRLLQLFRERHPLGTVVADLVRSDAGLYTVKAEVRIDRQWILGSGLAVHSDLEKAEERAMERALQVAGFGATAPARPEAALAQPPERPIEFVPYPAIAAPDEGTNGRTYPANGNLTNGSSANGHAGGAIQYATTGNGHSAISEPPPVLEPPVDLSDLLARTDVEMQRIGWGAKEGRDYLQRTFGKNSRHQLDGDELQTFLRHLKGQPNQLSRRPQAPF